MPEALLGLSAATVTKLEYIHLSSMTVVMAPTSSRALLGISGRTISHTAPRQHFSHCLEMSSYQVKILKKDIEKPDTLDLSQPSAQALIRRTLEDDGWLVLKNVTGLRPEISRQQVEQNPHIQSILSTLSLTRDGNFVSSHYDDREFPKDSSLIVGRSEDWEELAGKKEVVGIICCHLGGDSTQKWHILYDTSLRGETTNNMARVEAYGGDTILCNGWVRRSTPNPVGRAGRAIVVHYVWKRS